MKKSSFLIVSFFLVVFSASFWIYKNAAARAIELKALRTDDYQSGCGWSIEDPKKQFIVSIDIIDKFPAIVRFDGKRHELKWVTSTEPTVGNRVGDTFIKKYASDGVELVLNFTTTKICDPKDDHCENTDYSVDLYLKDHQRELKFQRLGGSSGC